MSVYDDNKYQATVQRWVDGDTVDLEVDLGFRVKRYERFRLLYIDAPETALRKGVTPEEKAAGLALKAYLSDEYPPGTKMVVKSQKADSFGRWLAEVWVPDLGDTSLNQWLLDEGLVEPY